MKTRKLKSLLIYIGFVLFLIFVGSVFLSQNNNLVYALNGELISKYNKELFTDYTQTSLRQEYNDLNVIESMKDELDQATYDRAVAIIKGEITYNPDKEFSTLGRGKELEQYGDTSNYSKTTLKFGYRASDLMVTGIYGYQGQTIKVFVEAQNSGYLPSIVFSQNHGYWSNGQWRAKRYLTIGENDLVFPTIAGSNVAASELKGGAIYIANPYTSEEQGDVSIYIEGAGFYPTFKVGDNKEEFLGKLKEYEERRINSPNTMFNMAELVPNNALFSIQSSVLYETYIIKNVDPVESLNLWSEYFRKSFEFNGIPLNEGEKYYKEINKHIRINLRWMTEMPASGAYATDYHIGIYVQSYWLANYHEDSHPVKGSLVPKQYFDIGHEVGHVLDVSYRTMAETTNNVNATNAYLRIIQRKDTSFQPFDKTFNHLYSDYTNDYNAFDDGKILYTSGNYDHNYLIWWYLESIYPGYWGELNNLFRFDNTFPHGNSLEKIVYYSSLITKRDLSEYFQRWGFYMDRTTKAKFTYNNSSSTFKNLMKEAISEGKIDANAYTHLWYVDASEYDFAIKNKDLENKQYKGTTPQIAKIKILDNIRAILIDCEKRDSNLLGYEILSSEDGITYKIAGFTYSNYFEDSHVYTNTPYYKVRAVNRFFNASDESEAKQTAQEEITNGVCRIDKQYFVSLKEAIDFAKTQEGEITIYLLESMAIDKLEFYINVRIEIDPSITSDIILTGGNDSLFRSHGNFYLFGNEKARIIIDGGSINRYNPAIDVGNGVFYGKYITFKDCMLKYLSGGAIATTFGNAKIENCIFINCSSPSNNSAIYISQITHDDNYLEISDCEFDNPNALADVWFGKKVILHLENSVPLIRINFPTSEGNQYIECNNCSLTSEDLNKISIVNNEYVASIEDNKIKLSQASFNLEFKYNAQTYNLVVSSREFVFGQENITWLEENKYVSSYQDENSLLIYHLGDKLILDQDMHFIITLEDKLVLTLEYLDDKETILFIKDGSLYLPRFDSKGKEIYAWEDGNEIFYSGTIYKVESSNILKAMYVNYFHVEYLNKEEIIKSEYLKYGSESIAPLVSDSDFLGWMSDKGLILANNPYQVTKNITLIAMYKNEVEYDLAKAEVEFVDNDFTYTGKAIKPRIKVLIEGKELLNYYYTIAYFNNFDVGEAKIVISSDYSTTTKEVYFTITSRLLSEEEVIITGIEDKVYDGTNKELDLLITWNNKRLDNNDFKVIYENNINAGLVEFEIRFLNNFSGSIFKSFTIEKARRNISVSLVDWVYNETPSELNLTGASKEEIESISYSDSKMGEYREEIPLNAGTYYVRVIIRENENYQQEITYNHFKINKANGSMVATIADWIYGENASVANIVSSTNLVQNKIITYRKKNEGEFSLQLPVNAGKYEMKIVLLETQNYLACELILDFNILKAQKPSDIPSVISVPSSAKIYEDIDLPSNWKWENGKELINREVNKANIVYDNDNFIETVFIVNLEFETEPILVEENDNGYVWIVVSVSLIFVTFIVSGSFIYKKKRFKVK